MNDKLTRYVMRIITLDRNERGISLFCWNEEDFVNNLKEENKHYGLHLISGNSEILLKMEYSNMYWDYRIYYGSYKKRYKPLLENDERWETIKKAIEFDLKSMGLEKLTNDIVSCLKNKNFYEYQNKVEEQFKNYCV